MKLRFNSKVCPKGIKIEGNYTACIKLDGEVGIAMQKEQKQEY